MSLATWRPVAVVALATLCFDLAFGKDAAQTRRLYSNQKQDRWVLKNSYRPGTFLEIGARDGNFFSNTRLLEENGWSGVCVEPFPSNFAKFNRTCKMLRYALVGEPNPDLMFSNCEDGSGITGWSGFTKTNKNKKEVVMNCSQVTVPQMAVSALQNQLPPVLDYISLDIEGLELEILNAWSFDKTCSKLWTVEAEAGSVKTAVANIFRGLGCETHPPRRGLGDLYAKCPCGDLYLTNLLDVKEQLKDIRRLAAGACFFAAVAAAGCLCQLLCTGCKAARRRRKQEEARDSPQRIGAAEGEELPLRPATL